MWFPKNFTIFCVNFEGFRIFIQILFRGSVTTQIIRSPDPCQYQCPYLSQYEMNSKTQLQYPCMNFVYTVTTPLQCQNNEGQWKFQGGGGRAVSKPHYKSTVTINIKT